MRLDHYHCVCGGIPLSATTRRTSTWAGHRGLGPTTFPVTTTASSTPQSSDGYWYLTDDVTLDREYNGFSRLHAPLPARQNDHADGKRPHKDHQGRADNHRLHGTGQDRLPEGRHRGRKKYQAGKLTPSEARSGAAPTEIPTGPASGS